MEYSAPDVWVVFRQAEYKLNPSVKSSFITARIDYAIDYATENNHDRVKIYLPIEYRDAFLAINTAKINEYITAAYQSNDCLQLIRSLRLTHDYLHLDLTQMRKLIDAAELAKYKTAVLNYIEHALNTCGYKLELMHEFLTEEFYTKYVDRIDFHKYKNANYQLYYEVSQYPIKNLPDSLAIANFPTSIWRFISNVPINVLQMETSNNGDDLDFMCEYAEDFVAIDIISNKRILDSNIIAKNRHIPEWFVDKHLYELSNCIDRDTKNMYLIIKSLEIYPERVARSCLRTKGMLVTTVNTWIDKFDLQLCEGHTDEFYNSLILKDDEFQDLEYCAELSMDFITKNLNKMLYFNPDNRRLTRDFILKNANYITKVPHTLADWKISDQFANQLVGKNASLLRALEYNKWLTSEFYSRYTYNAYDITLFCNLTNAYLLDMYWSQCIHRIVGKIHGNYHTCNKYIHQLEVFGAIPLQLYIDRNIKTKLECIDRNPPISDVVLLMNE